GSTVQLAASSQAVVDFMRRVLLPQKREEFGTAGRTERAPPAVQHAATLAQEVPDHEPSTPPAYPPALEEGSSTQVAAALTRSRALRPATDQQVHDCIEALH